MGEDPASGGNHFASDIAGLYRNRRFIDVILWHP
jgi:hypothetical protein